MASKRKPSFEISGEARDASQSGWVYRSDSSTSHSTRRHSANTDKASSKKASSQQSAQRRDSSGTDIVGVTARTMSSSFMVVGRMLALGTRLITAPFTIGLRLLGSLTSRN